jgi:hypothetical protein
MKIIAGLQHDSRSASFISKKPFQNFKSFCLLQRDTDVIKIDIQCEVHGDVVMECIHLDLESEREKEELMFRFVFNTAFVRSNLLVLSRDEIDIPWNTKERFEKEFRAEVSLFWLT